MGGCDLGARFLPLMFLLVFLSTSSPTRDFIVSGGNVPSARPPPARNKVRLCFGSFFALFKFIRNPLEFWRMSRRLMRPEFPAPAPGSHGDDLMEPRPAARGEKCRRGAARRRQKLRPRNFSKARGLSSRHGGESGTFVVLRLGLGLKLSLL